MNLRYFLIMAALVCVTQAVAAPQASRLFEPAPRDDTGAFMNPVGDLSQGSLGVRVPFMLRRFGTYFRGDEGAPSSDAAERPTDRGSGFNAGHGDLGWACDGAGPNAGCHVFNGPNLV